MQALQHLCVLEEALWRCPNQQAPSSAVSGTFSDVPLKLEPFSVEQYLASRQWQSLMNCDTRQHCAT